MDLRPYPLNSLTPYTLLPRSRWARFGGARVCVEGDGRKVLEESDDHERHFVVCELVSICVECESCDELQDTDLLTQTDPRPCVEREEDERVLGEIRFEPVIEEAVRVELLGYKYKIE